MWSEQPAPERLSELIARLRAILPAPSGGALSREEALRGEPPPEAVAGMLNGQPGFLWLDGGARQGRILSAPRATITVHNGWASVQGPGGQTRFPAGGFELLDAALALWSGPRGACLAGYFSYELARELERLDPPPETADGVPDLYLGLFDASLAYDSGGWRLHTTDAWRGRGGWATRLSEAEQLLSRAAALPCQPAPEGPLSTGPVTSRPDREEFRVAVARTVRRIREGEIFQTNLCRTLEAPLEEARIWPYYLRLRALSAGRYGGFLQLGQGRAVLSVSPELYLELRRQAGRKCTVAESKPIKGTRPRGATPEEDERLAAGLLASRKDRAELAMIVDVVRNDLGRVCATNSIRVPAHAELVTLPTVHHTVSTVTGELRADRSVTDLLRASFPPASITGAPKIRAMQVAMEEEGLRRGPCMGSLGWISLDGEAELSTAIRTAVAAGGRIRYLAGAGITAESEPEAELAETGHKARAFVRALGLE